MFKYTLITSQYWHSYHMFIVEHNEDTFIKQAKACSRELIKYKGQSTKDYLGDLDYNYGDSNIRHRYNINEHGDIYIQNFEKLDAAVRLVKEIYERRGKRFKRLQKKRYHTRH